MLCVRARSGRPPGAATTRVAFYGMIQVEVYIISYTNYLQRYNTVYAANLRNATRVITARGTAKTTRDVASRFPISGPFIHQTTSMPPRTLRHSIYRLCLRSKSCYCECVDLCQAAHMALRVDPCAWPMAACSFPVTGISSVGTGMHLPYTASQWVPVICLVSGLGFLHSLHPHCSYLCTKFRRVIVLSHSLRQ